MPLYSTQVRRNLQRYLSTSPKYHGHLGDQELTPEEISDGTFDSTRRLYVLMQACLLREIGLDTAEVESLIATHYLSWPIP